jgi:hypothetical protein
MNYWTIALATVAIPLASVAHELSHVGAAHVVRAEADLDMAGLAVQTRGSRAQNQVVAAAPMATGLVAGMGYLTVYGLPAVTPTNALASIAWANYTLNAADNRYTKQLVRDWQELPQPIREAVWHGVVIVGIGLAIGLVLPYPLKQYVPMAYGYLGLGNLIWQGEKWAMQQDAD